ncbi:MAG: hypothetical protein QGF00_14250 [Planctomycetota bacterium]|jgi:hypothetical protein|nr:hypothetical protein [Planctomycetota bacterium]MDP7250763.1 hypothetical protein [Planctomycetota bacterium]
MRDLVKGLWLVSWVTFCPCAQSDWFEYAFDGLSTPDHADPAWTD